MQWFLPTLAINSFPSAEIMSPPVNLIPSGERLRDLD
jgi:hypothetical protein